jgi:hypothetical protein
MKSIGIATIVFRSLACAATPQWSASVTPDSGSGEDGRFEFTVNHTAGRSPSRASNCIKKRRPPIFPYAGKPNPQARCFPSGERLGFSAQMKTRPVASGTSRMSD